MKTIPQKTVDAAWERMGDLTEEETRQLAERMQREQPAIMMHLLAVEQAEQSVHDPGWLLELGAFAWWVMEKASKKLPCPTPEELDAAEALNTKELEQLDGQPEKAWMDTARKLIKFYNQAPLLSLAIEVLISESEENPEASDNEVGLGFLHLKTILDCLDKS